MHPVQWVIVSWSHGVNNILDDPYLVNGMEM
jgi:hypothetical protein